MDINGFTIDVYNRYGLKDGARYSHCPLCSHTRSRSNQKAKCMSCDWTRGLAKCHHCGEVLQLHTYQSKKSMDKPYYAHKEHNDGTITYYYDDGTMKRK